MVPREWKVIQTPDVLIPGLRDDLAAAGAPPCDGPNLAAMILFEKFGHNLPSTARQAAVLRTGGRRRQYAIQRLVALTQTGLFWQKPVDLLDPSLLPMSAALGSFWQIATR